MKSQSPTDALYNPVRRLENVWKETFFREVAFDLWRAHLEWLAKLGWADALREEADIKSIPTIENPQHEVVEMLQDFVLETGLVNAHFGLTSSDVVDNVRLIQCQRSIDTILGQLDSLVGFLVEKASKDLTPGYTHLVPAAPLSWSHRVLAWSTPLMNLRNSPPLVHAKWFGGPVGDGASLDRVANDLLRSKYPFPWEEVFDLAPPINHHPLQSSDHVVEIRLVDWLGQVAAQVHKVAMDLRLLFSKGDIEIVRPAPAGSSSMPHKVNPFKWEKVCSICRSVATTRQEIWDVMAHNSLERTLDTSWQIKRLLPRAFLGLAEALMVLESVEWRPTLKSKGSGQLMHNSDSELTSRVIDKGESRWHAYVKSLSQR